MEEDILNYSPTVMFRGTYPEEKMQVTKLSYKEDDIFTNLVMHLFTIPPTFLIYLFIYLYICTYIYIFISAT